MPINMELLDDYMRRRYPLPGDRPQEPCVVTAINIPAGTITLDRRPLSGGDYDTMYVGRVNARDYYVGMEVTLAANRRQRTAEEIAARADSVERRLRDWSNRVVRQTTTSFVVDDTNIVAEPPKSKHRELTAAEIAAEPVW